MTLYRWCTVDQELQEFESHCTLEGCSVVCCDEKNWFTTPQAAMKGAIARLREEAETKQAEVYRLQSEVATLSAKQTNIEWTYVKMFGWNKEEPSEQQDN